MKEIGELYDAYYHSEFSIVDSNVMSEIKIELLLKFDFRFFCGFAGDETNLVMDFFVSGFDVLFQIVPADSFIS